MSYGHKESQITTYLPTYIDGHQHVTHGLWQVVVACKTHYIYLPSMLSILVAT